MYLTAITTIFIFMVFMWGLSLFYKDASLIDRVWGLNFVLIYFSQLSLLQDISIRQGLVGTLVFLWATRLCVHLHLRNRHIGEDKRYVAMREEHGPQKFWWYSFFSVFFFQGMIALLVSAPLLHLSHHSGGHSFLWTDAVGLCLWIIGMTFECVGDWQLTHFIRYQKKPGEVFTKGLWSLTRHPNYFGDAIIWLGYFSFACSTQNGWMTFFGPATMLFFLRYVSGVSLLETNLQQSRPRYIEKTSDIPAWIPNVTTIYRGITELYQPRKEQNKS